MSYQRIGDSVISMESEDLEEVDLHAQFDASKQDLHADRRPEIGVSPSQGSNVSATTNKKAVPKPRGVARTVTKISCEYMLSRVMFVISVILGLLVLVGAGLLVYAGFTVRSSDINLSYVFWAFGGISLLASLYIIFRTFSMDRAIADLYKVRDELEATEKSLNQDANKFDEENEELKQHIDRFGKQERSLNARIEELERTSNQVNAELNGLKAINKSLETTNMRMKTEADDFSKENKRLQEEINAEKQIVASLMSEVSSLNSIKANLEENSNKLNSEVDDLRNVNNDMKIELQTAQKNNLKQEELTKKLQDEISKIKSEREALVTFNEKLKTATTALTNALVQAKDSTIDVDKILRETLVEIEKHGVAIKDEREAQERFTLHLADAIFKEMDANGDGAISVEEFKEWGRKKK